MAVPVRVNALNAVIAGNVGNDRRDCVLAIWSSTFVPKGLNDRSLAVYCQGCAQQTIRPGGYGVISWAYQLSPAFAIQSSFNR